LTSAQAPRHPEIGKTIRSLRLRLGLTQEKLALEVNISNSEISRLERGKRNPKWKTMERLAKGLDVPCWQMVWLAEQFKSGKTWSEIAWPPPPI